MEMCFNYVQKDFGEVSSVQRQFRLFARACKYLGGRSALCPRRPVLIKSSQPSIQISTSHEAPPHLPPVQPAAALTSARLTRRTCPLLRTPWKKTSTSPALLLKASAFPFLYSPGIFYLNKEKHGPWASQGAFIYGCMYACLHACISTSHLEI